MRKSIQERVKVVAERMGFVEQDIISTFPHLFVAEGDYIYAQGQNVKDSDLPSYIDHTLLKPQAKQVCNTVLSILSSFPPFLFFLYQKENQGQNVKGSDLPYYVTLLNHKTK